MVGKSSSDYALECVAKLNHLESFSQIELQRPLPLIKEALLCQRRMHTIVAVRQLLNAITDGNVYLPQSAVSENDNLTAAEKFVKDLDRTINETFSNLQNSGVLQDAKTRARFLKTANLLKVSAIKAIRDRLGEQGKPTAFLNNALKFHCRSTDKRITFDHRTLQALHHELGQIMTTITQKQIVPNINRTNYHTTLSTVAQFEPEWFQNASGLYQPTQAQGAQPADHRQCDGLMFESNFNTQTDKLMPKTGSRQILLNVIRQGEKIPELNNKLNALRDQFNALASKQDGNGRPVVRFRTHVQLLNAPDDEKKPKHDPRNVYAFLCSQLRSIANGKNTNNPDAIKALVKYLETVIEQDGLMEWIIQHMATSGTKNVFSSPIQLMTGAPFRMGASNPLNLLEALYCKGSDGPFCAPLFHQLRLCFLSGVAAPTDDEYGEILRRYEGIDSGKSSARMIGNEVKDMLTAFKLFKEGNLDSFEPNSEVAKRRMKPGSSTRLELDYVMSGMMAVLSQRIRNIAVRDPAEAPDTRYQRIKLFSRYDDLLKKNANRLKP